MKPWSSLEKVVVIAGFIVAAASGVYAWRAYGPHGERADIDPRVRRIYNATTGRVDVVVFDSDGDLRFDTWSYMDGDRLVRMDTDDDGNGTIDRRQYFRPGEILDQTEFLDAAGRIVRTEPAVAGSTSRP